VRPIRHPMSSLRAPMNAWIVYADCWTQHILYLWNEDDGDCQRTDGIMRVGSPRRDGSKMLESVSAEGNAQKTSTVDQRHPSDKVWPGRTRIMRAFLAMRR
jgi:hypothetical protein